MPLKEKNRILTKESRCILLGSGSFFLVFSHE